MPVPEGVEEDLGAKLCSLRQHIARISSLPLLHRGRKWAMHLSSAADGESALSHAHAIETGTRNVSHTRVHVHHKAIPATHSDRL